MKKLFVSLFYIFAAIAVQAQQYAVYATPAGIVKPLPNGNTVLITAGAGGSPGQIQWNNAGLLGGFTVSGDATIVPSTGLLAISTNVVTNAKLAQMAASSFKANNSLSSANASDLSVADAKALLAIVPGDIAGLGTMAIQNAGSVNITGGTESGVAISGGTVTGSAISGGSITGLPSPTLNSDAATKAYVDGVASGIVQRTGVAVATTASVTLSGEQTIDGVLTSATRIMVKNQSAPAENGIYVTAAGAWSRATDSNTAAELLVGYLYFVSGGSTQAGSSWAIQSPAPVTLGTDPVTFAQFSASQVYSAGAGLSLTGNTFANVGVLSVAGTAGQITASASTGALTLSTPSSLTFTGKTVTGGTYNSGAFNGTVGATTPAGGIFTSLTSTSGAFNGTVGATTPSTIAGTSAVVQSVAATPSATPYAYLATVNSAAASAMRIVDTNTSGRTWYVGPAIAGALVTDFCIYDFSGSAFALKATSTGINSTAIGATTPSTGAFTTLTGSSTATGSATARTLAARFNDVTNVLDYGADPTGSADSSAALVAAVTALPSTRSCLYLPPGRYKWSSASTFTISGKANISIIGPGAELYDNNTAAARPFVVIDKTCSYVQIAGLAFNGNASSRVAGAHQLILNASHSQVSRVSMTNGSQFSFYIGSDSSFRTTDVILDQVSITNTWADGFHIFYAQDVTLSNCYTNTTGDDGCGIIADTATFNPQRITLINFNAVQAGNVAGGGTHGASIRINEATDVKVIGGSSIQGAEAGIVIDRFNSTTFYNARILISGFYSYLDAAYLSGGRIGEGIDLRFSNTTTIENCVVESPTRTNNAGIGLLDFNNLVVSGCKVHNPGLRGIACDDGATSNVGATWSGAFINNNFVDGTCTNESIYMTTASSKSIAALVCNGNQENISGSFRSIFTDYLTAGCKVGNSVLLGSRGAPANGGHGSAPTVFNNQ